MKTTYTLTEAQTHLQLTPTLFATLLQKYEVEAEVQPGKPQAVRYHAADLERLRFELNRQRPPLITMLNADYAPDVSAQFCQMLHETCAAPVAVVTVPKESSLERLGAVVSVSALEDGCHRYELPPAKAPSSDFLLAWEAWDQSLTQLTQQYARVVLLVEAEARLTDSVLLSSSSICAFLRPDQMSQVNEVVGELQARLEVVSRCEGRRKPIELTAMILVGTEDEIEGKRWCQRLQAEQPQVMFTLPELSDADSFLRFWYTRKRASLAPEQ
jgi:hypothetical protein